MSYRITLLTHGEVERRGPNLILSDLGKMQSDVRREDLGNIEFDLVCHSGRAQTLTTACVIAGINPPNKILRKIYALFYTRNFLGAELLNNSFQSLGNASLRTYCKRNKDCEGLTEVIGCFGRNELLGAINRKKAEEILVVGHPILIPALCTFLDPPRKKVYTNARVDECGGWRITCPDSHDTHIERF